ncbi:MAG: hypothetical protein AB8G05_12825 [Oligoflexales bacterium]
MGAAFKLRNGSLLITTEAPGGIYNSEQLKKIASLADEDSAIVKVTEDQRLALFVGEDKADGIVAELKTIGLGVRHYQDGLHQPTTCIGELCPEYQQDALGSALKITEEMSRLSVDNPLKIGINGCAQCCVPCHTLDISIVGDEQGYRISMGGKNSQIPEMATFMAEGVPEAKLPTMIHNIVQLYQDSAEEAESLQDVMDRVGVSKFAEVLAPYSQDAAGGDDLFGDSNSLEQPLDSENQVEQEDNLEMELPDEGEQGLVSENIEGEDFSDLEEVDDFDQGTLEEDSEDEISSSEEVTDQFIDDGVDSDFVDSDELELDTELEEGQDETLSDEIEAIEEDEFADVDESQLDSDIDVEERLAAAESEGERIEQEEELQQLDSMADDEDLELSDFEAGDADLEIGDEELDQSSNDGLEVIQPVTGEDSELDGDLVIGTEEHESSESVIPPAEDIGESENEDLDDDDDLELSEISEEDLDDLDDEIEDDLEDEEVLSLSGEEQIPSDLEEDLLETSDIEEDENLMFDASDEDLQEIDSKEADEMEQRINDDIRDSQAIHEPDTNEQDRNAVLRKVEGEGASLGENIEEQKTLSPLRDIRTAKSQAGQFQFEGFDVKENGDFIITFTSGAQFQFNYDLIKDGPRKIKLGSQSISIGLDSSMIFFEFDDGLKMNLPLNAA